VDAGVGLGLAWVFKNAASQRLKGDTSPQNGCCGALESTANLQKAKQIGDSRRSRALARRCTALEKLPHVNFLILRDLGELAVRDVTSSRRFFAKISSQLAL
jgi:hypothetical protein